MQILTMSNSQSNQVAHQDLRARYLEEPVMRGPDKSLVFIDLDSRTELPIYRIPEPFAAELAQLKGSLEIEEIYLVIPDFYRSEGLAAYANQLAYCLHKHLNHSVIVHIASDLNYDKTYLEHGKEWKIYGQNFNKRFNQNAAHEVLLWHGSDLLKWMQDPQRSFDGHSLSWGPAAH